MGTSGVTEIVVTEEDEWYRHDAITALRPISPGSPSREPVVIGCVGCDWVSTDESYSSVGFAAHLRQLGAEDYMVHYWEDWADIVEVPWGQLDRHAVARELSDYTMVMGCASTVFSEISGFSKPHTAPQYVLAENERRMAGNYAANLCEEAYAQLADGNLRTALAMRALAEQWHPGAWEEFSQDARQRREWMAKQQVKPAV